MPLPPIPLIPPHRRAFNLPLRLRQSLIGIDKLPATTVWVSVSGGLDSKVLLHLLTHLSRENNAGFDVAAVHLRHHLEVDEPLWEEAVGALADTLSVPLKVLDAPSARHHPQGLESAARQQRLRAWQNLARECLQINPERYPHNRVVVALAHHAHDVGETLIHRMGRGAGLRGLAVLPPYSDWPIPTTPGRLMLWRPLLAWHKKDIEDYGQNHAIVGANDPANDDRQRTRALIRQDIMPPLLTHFPSFVDNAVRLSRLAHEEINLLQECADEWLSALMQGEHTINQAGFLALSRVKQKLVLRRLMELFLTASSRRHNEETINYPLSSAQLSALINAIHQSKEGCWPHSPLSMLICWNEKTLSVRDING